MCVIYLQILQLFCVAHHVQLDIADAGVRERDATDLCVLCNSMTFSSSAWWLIWLGGLGLLGSTGGLGGAKRNSFRYEGLISDGS